MAQGLTVEAVRKQNRAVDRLGDGGTERAVDIASTASSVPTRAPLPMLTALPWEGESGPRAAAVPC